MKSFASSWRLQNVYHQFFKLWERDEDQKFWTSKVKVVSWSEDSKFLLQDFSEIGLQVPLPSVSPKFAHNVWCWRLEHLRRESQYSSQVIIHLPEAKILHFYLLSGVLGELGFWGSLWSLMSCLIPNTLCKFLCPLHLLQHAYMCWTQIQHLWTRDILLE